MKRLTRVLVCAALMASSLIMPVGAWDKYSFVGDSVYFSGQDAMLRDPAVFPQADSSSSDSLSGFDFISQWRISPDTKSIGVQATYHFDDTIGGIDVDEDLPLMQPGTFLDFNNPATDPSLNRIYVEKTLTIPDTAVSSFDNQLQSIDNLLFGPSGFSGPGSNAKFYFQYDFASFFSEFSAFSLSGTLRGNAYIYSSGSYLDRSGISRIELLVNGSLTRTFYPSDSDIFDFADYIYSGSVPVTQISFRFYPDAFNYSRTFSSDFTAIFGLSVYVDDSLRVDVLTGESVLDGQVSDAQDQINDWDSIESEFGSDATEGFNGLDLDNFTYPSDFLAAFSLVSGIFTDLWNCMGDFQIIYLLPLTLGICLLLVGRVSRSSVPSPPPLHTDLPVSNSLGPPSRPALKGGKR